MRGWGWSPNVPSAPSSRSQQAPGHGAPRPGERRCCRETGSTGAARPPRSRACPHGEPCCGTRVSGFSRDPPVGSSVVPHPRLQRAATSSLQTCPAPGPSSSASPPDAAVTGDSGRAEQAFIAGGTWEVFKQNGLRLCFREVWPGSTLSSHLVKTVPWDGWEWGAIGSQSCSARLGLVLGWAGAGRTAGSGCSGVTCYRTRLPLLRSHLGSGSCWWENRPEGSAGSPAPHAPRGPCSGCPSAKAAAGMPWGLAPPQERPPLCPSAPSKSPQGHQRPLTRHPRYAGHAEAEPTARWAARQRARTPP